MTQPLRLSLFGILSTPAAQNLRATDKLLLVYLKWRQGDNGHSWPSLTTIGDDLGVCRRTCLRAIARLCESGCIEKMPGSPGRGHSNRYAVTAEKRTHDAIFSTERKGRTTPPFDARKGGKLSPKKDAPCALKEQGKEPTKSITCRSSRSHRQLPKAKTTPFTPPTVEQVREYAAAQGYPDFDAEKFIRHYEADDWHDVNGRPVRNWKRKFLNVWAENAASQAGREPQPGDPDWLPTEDEADKVLAKLGGRP